MTCMLRRARVRWDNMEVELSVCISWGHPSCHLPNTLATYVVCSLSLPPPPPPRRSACQCCWRWTQPPASIRQFQIPGCCPSYQFAPPSSHKSCSLRHQILTLCTHHSMSRPPPRGGGAAPAGGGGQEGSRSGGCWGRIVRALSAAGGGAPSTPPPPGVHSPAQWLLHAHQQRPHAHGPPPPTR
jgi:hypothetical protein